MLLRLAAVGTVLGVPSATGVLRMVAAAGPGVVDALRLGRDTKAVAGTKAGAESTAAWGSAEAAVDLRDGGRDDG